MPVSQRNRPIRLLVVDDEADTVDLLAEFCRGRGMDVTTACDGRAAVTAIERTPSRFDIVITDLHLPGADGFDVLRAAHRANPSCYVVMITGYATIDSAVRAVREGAYDYLPKPFTLGQIEIVLCRIIDRMALEFENRELLRRREPERDAALAGSLFTRLDAIEDRLARIEALLRQG